MEILDERETQPDTDEKRWTSNDGFALGWVILFWETHKISLNNQKRLIKANVKVFKIFIKINNFDKRPWSYKPFSACPPVWFPFIFVISCFSSASCFFTSEIIYSIFLEFGPAWKVL